MGADFGNAWQSDNKDKAIKSTQNIIKTANKHRLYFAKEKRRGKTVTIVKDFYLSKNDLNTLLKTLKKSLGIGGTSKENHLEFQGEVKEKLQKQLLLLGYALKH